MENDRSAKTEQSERCRALSYWQKPIFWAIFALSGITICFFCIASILGYVDAIIILVAQMVLFCVIRRPKPVHLTTAVLLSMITGIMLWANLRPTGWQREFGVDTPTELDLIIKALFWRGWPLSPFMASLDMMFRSPGGQLLLVCDCVLFVVALYTVKIISEQFLRWHDRRRHVGGELKPGRRLNMQDGSIRSRFPPSQDGLE
jgi:hypothetical protein